MDRLKFVVPSKKWEEEAIDYINEHYEYNSLINGSGSLYRFLDDYDGWLEKLDSDRKCIPSEERVPTETYFLVRESDDKIVGMINIRLALNKKLKEIGGHIGYGIRPTERRKGYNKINLYLGLLRCKEYGIDEVLLDCDKDNLGSAKTMKALGGRLVKEFYDDKIYNCIVQGYVIDVNEAIDKYNEIYEPMIAKSKVK